MILAMYYLFVLACIFVNRFKINSPQWPGNPYPAVYKLMSFQLSACSMLRLYVQGTIADSLVFVDSIIAKLIKISTIIHVHNLVISSDLSTHTIHN